MRDRDSTFSNTVWIITEDVFGVLVGPMGTYFSMVKYTKGGIEFELLLENEDFMTMDEMFGLDDD